MNAGSVIVILQIILAAINFEINEVQNIQMYFNMCFLLIQNKLLTRQSSWVCRNPDQVFLASI